MKEVSASPKPSTLPAAAVIGAGIVLAANAAHAQEKRADNDPLKNLTSSKRDEWFKAAPDPWRELSTLEFGADRSFASGLQTLIQDADAEQWPGLERRLIDVLHRSDCTDAARDFVCRMLRLIGSLGCVNALVPLLEDNEQSNRARYALQGIPGEPVNAAFRAALPRLSGDPKAGLIGSIAVRGDQKAIPALEAIRQNSRESDSVRQAAQQALTHLNS